MRSNKTTESLNGVKVNKKGQRSAYATRIRPKLELIEGWARNGLTDKQIIVNLGISAAAYYANINLYSDFAETLQRGREVTEILVENALLKRALGYKYREVTRERKYNEVTNEYELMITKIVTKQVYAHVDAAIYWLEHRAPSRWIGKNLEHEKQRKQIELLDNQIKSGAGPDSTNTEQFQQDFLKAVSSASKGVWDGEED